MKMTSEKRAIDKIFKRRDRYDIPEWQRERVWNKARKQKLIDSILRGWKLPKFYFVKSSGEDYLVEDGQQRLTAIFEFFSNDLTLSTDSAKQFRAKFYGDLPRAASDAFDDFEIEYDIIEEATDEDLKEFFQRLQQGMPLNSSEKLNAVHSKLRDYCMAASQHAFLKKTIAVDNTRYAHFDILAKVATVEIEGLDAGLRFDDIREVFLAQATFSSGSAVARKIKSALDLLNKAFRNKGSSLRTRTIVQSLITLTCRLVSTGRAGKCETQLRKFFETFMGQLAEQVEMGQNATDSDYVGFQRSVNANVIGAARTRQEIMLRKLFLIEPALAKIFDPSVIAESGLSGHVARLADSIRQLVANINSKYAAKNGEDLFKATNKTSQAMVRIGRSIQDFAGYESLIDDLYFLFREAPGTRISTWPSSFTNINELRTDLRHDTDHGEASKIRAKKRKANNAFLGYAGEGTPQTMDPGRFPLVQANILSAIEGDLRGILSKDL